MTLTSIQLTWPSLQSRARITSPRMAPTTTQPRRRLSKEARRAKLIAAAEAVFAEVGHGGATMELVAAHDGVTRSLLYAHFASIDEIYLECHRTAREEMEQRVFQAVALAGSDLQDQLRVGLTAYFGAERIGALFIAAAPYSQIRSARRGAHRLRRRGATRTLVAP